MKEPSEIERKVLDYLRKYPYGTSASMVGAEIWDNKKRGRVVASQGGGDYAAQMLLGRMRKKGWVNTLFQDGSSQWVVTREAPK